ncbi:Protein CBG10938 [Caenorhabditis briggsae]|uniref:Protein CBG10938 n=1 Tax=Caenorhabditis briggsae TaxID=6238 RepID=A8XBX1_CAEBR|nr:Protein CBG10938 [Caenorhabditis briggsae]CAP30209.2 Protein CBG10938 [Caenorhabditis briggsae]
MNQQIACSLFLTLLVVGNGQYPPENPDNILPYSPPGHMPPMPPLDPPGYDPQLIYETTPTSGLRAPPMPIWTKEAQEESSGQSLSADETSEQQDDHVEVGSGDGSGVEGSAEEEFGFHSGFQSLPESASENGSGSGWDLEYLAGFELPEYEGGQDDFPDIMQSMDEEAEKTGIDCPSDIVFIIDATSSVKGVFDEQIKFIEKVIEGLDIRPRVDHVGAIVYSSERKQRQKIKLGEHKDMASLMKAVDNLPFFSGITATGEALKFAATHTEGRRDNLTLNYVVLTDGYSYDIIESGARLLREVPNSVVYAVTIGEIYLRKELELITGNKSNVMIGSMSYGTVVKRIKNCEARARAQQLRDENPVELVHPGEFLSDAFSHRQSVQTNENIKKDEPAKDSVTEPTDKLPVNDCQYDVGIIFDSSGSLEKNFQTQLQIANKLFQVAIVQFAGKSKTRVLADFVQNKTKDQLEKIIEKSPFYSGTTFTNQALKRMALLFEASKRDNCKMKLLVFTDGYSAEDTAEGIEALKRQGITVYTVGISTDKNAGLNVSELKGMATSPSHYFDSSDFDNLLKHFPSTEYC